MKKLNKLNITAYITVILLAGIYLLILIFNLKDLNLSDFPELKYQTLINGTFAEEFEEYLKENLSFHDVLFQIKSKTDLIIGEKMIQDIYITEERLMKKPSSFEAGGAEQINEFYDKYPLPCYLVIVPSASEIYEETLPAHGLYTSQEKWIKAVYADTGTGIRCIDTCHILNSLEDSYIYYRTDSHWTSCGAFS